MIVIVIAALLTLGAAGIATMGLVFAKVKELHDWGYSWSYSFSLVLGGLS